MHNIILIALVLIISGPTILPAYPECDIRQLPSPLQSFVHDEQDWEARSGSSEAMEKALERWDSPYAPHLKVVMPLKGCWVSKKELSELGNADFLHLPHNPLNNQFLRKRNGQEEFLFFMHPSSVADYRLFHLDQEKPDRECLNFCATPTSSVRTLVVWQEPPSLIDFTPVMIKTSVTTVSGGMPKVVEQNDSQVAVQINAALIEQERIMPSSTPLNFFQEPLSVSLLFADKVGLPKKDLIDHEQDKIEKVKESGAQKLQESRVQHNQEEGEDNITEEKKAEENRPSHPFAALGAGMIVREIPERVLTGKYQVISGISLFGGAVDPNSKKVSYLFRKYKAKDLPKLMGKIESRFLRPFVTHWLELFINKGLILEPHAQNLMMEIGPKDSLPTGVFWHRDLDGLLFENDTRRVRDLPTVETQAIFNLDLPNQVRRSIYSMFGNGLLFQMSTSIANWASLKREEDKLKIYGHFMRVVFAEMMSGLRELVPFDFLAEKQCLTAIESGIEKLVKNCYIGLSFLLTQVQKVKNVDFLAEHKCHDDFVYDAKLDGDFIMLEKFQFILRFDSEEENACSKEDSKKSGIGLRKILSRITNLNTRAAPLNHCQKLVLSNREKWYRDYFNMKGSSPALPEQMN